MNKKKKDLVLPPVPPLGMPIAPLGSDIPVTTDPQGSYTGVPADPTEVPVQDADDL